MTSFQFEKRWYAVTSKEYQRLLRLVRQKESTVIDSYGATSKEEFFAVSTECFLTNPHALSDEHPELYEVLVKFYGQDPREWLSPLRSESQIA